MRAWWMSRKLLYSLDLAGKLLREPQEPALRSARASGFARLGLPDARGKRYSWGYGACPDLTQHELVWKLLGVEEAIGARLTSAYQIIPEQSTAALIIH